MPSVVAILNTSDDVVELLRVVFEQAGLIAVSAHLDAVKRGAVDLEQFVRTHAPDAIVYDVAPPYDRQWAFLQHLRSLPMSAGIPFVLTSTNAARLRDIVGTDEMVHEIIGKPYDLEHILGSVRRAIEAGANQRKTGAGGRPFGDSSA